MKIYNYLKNLGKTAVVLTGLAALLSPLGCEAFGIHPGTPKDSSGKTLYEFSDFGKLPTNCFNGGVAVGDIDGDEDLDIICVGTYGINIFENKMPQKNR